MGGRAWAAWRKKSAPALYPIYPLYYLYDGPRKKGDKNVPGPQGPPGILCLANPAVLAPSYTLTRPRCRRRLPRRAPPLKTVVRRLSVPMALDAAVFRPPQVPVVAAASVSLEARQSTAAVRKRKNKIDLAFIQIYIQYFCKENRRPNMYSIYNKY